MTIWHIIITAIVIGVGGPLWLDRKVFGRWIWQKRR
jgi:hypothetical protein